MRLLSLAKPDPAIHGIDGNNVDARIESGHDRNRCRVVRWESNVDV